jgi:hypothetical protein
MFRLPGGSLFKSPSPPPTYSEPTPTLEDDDVQKKRDEERRAQKRRRGLAGTIMTSGLGDTAKPNISRSLLGN